MVHNVCSSFWQCDGVCPSCKKNGPPPDPATLLRLEDGKSAIVVPIDRVRPLSDPPAAAAHVASPLSLRGGALSIGEGSDNEGDEGNRPNHQSTQTMAETPRESNDGSLEALHPGSQGTSRVSSIRWQLGNQDELDNIVDGALGEARQGEGHEEADGIVDADFDQVVTPSDKAQFVGAAPPMSIEAPFPFVMRFGTRTLGFKIGMDSHGGVATARPHVHVVDINREGSTGSNLERRNDTVLSVNGTPILSIISDNFRDPTLALIRHVQNLNQDATLDITFRRHPEGHDFTTPPDESSTESDPPQRTTGQGFIAGEDFQASKEGEFFVGKSVKVLVGTDSIDATVIRCCPGNKYVVQFVDFNQRGDEQVDRSQLTAVEPIPDEDDPEPDTYQSGRPGRSAAFRALRYIRHQESHGTDRTVVPFYMHWSYRNREKSNRPHIEQRPIILDYHDPEYQFEHVSIHRQDEPLNIERIIRSFEGGDEVIQKLRNNHGLLWLKNDEAERPQGGFEDEIRAGSSMPQNQVPLFCRKTTVIQGFKYRPVRNGLATCSRCNLSSYPCGGRIIYRDGKARITVGHSDTCRVNTLLRLMSEDPELGLTPEMLDAIIVKLLECKEFGVIVDQKRVSPPQPSSVKMFDF